MLAAPRYVTAKNDDKNYEWTRIDPPAPSCSEMSPITPDDGVNQTMADRLQIRMKQYGFDRNALDVGPVSVFVYFASIRVNSRPFVVYPDFMVLEQKLAKQVRPRHDRDRNISQSPKAFQRN
jgi:hypothetical protein